MTASSKAPIIPAIVLAVPAPQPAAPAPAPAAAVAVAVAGPLIPARFEGWAAKEGGSGGLLGRSVKQRFFVADKGLLSYFEKAGDPTSEKGCLSLTGYVIDANVAGNVNKFVLVVSFFSSFKTS